MTITIVNSTEDDFLDNTTVAGLLTLTESEEGNLFPSKVLCYYENPKIVKVTQVSSSEKLLDKITFTCNGSNVVTYNGSPTKILTAGCKYVLPDGSTAMVTDIDSIPSVYTAVYAHVPPSRTVETVTVSLYAWTHDNDVVETNNPVVGVGYSAYSAVPSDLSTITPVQMTMVGTYTLNILYNGTNSQEAFKAAVENGVLAKQATRRII
jgi:hypothetical protein